MKVGRLHGNSVVVEIALTLTVRRSKSAYEVDALLAILKGAVDAAGASLRICSGSVKEAVARASDHCRAGPGASSRSYGCRGEVSGSSVA